MAEFKIYHLYWEEHEWNSLLEKDYTSDKDYGIYQAYGDHSVYGKDTLLYIGKTNRQTFSKRFSGHYDFDTTPISRFTRFYIGCLCKVDDVDEKNWNEAINIVEKPLIKAHMPALNSQEVMGFLDNQTPNILIYNWGNRGGLLSEVSTLRHTGVYHNSKKYNFKELVLRDANNQEGGK